MLYGEEWFSEEICLLNGCWHIIDFYFFCLDAFSNKVVLDSYIFGSSMND